ncbi:unnamed protein product [Prunus armeniaca]
MATTTSLVGTTLLGQVIERHSPSHPSLSLRSSPPSIPPTRMSWCTRHLSYLSLPPGNQAASLCPTRVSSVAFISSVATIPNLVRESWTNMCTISHPLHLTLTNGRST